MEPDRKRITRAARKRGPDRCKQPIVCQGGAVGAALGCALERSAGALGEV